MAEKKAQNNEAEVTADNKEVKEPKELKDLTEEELLKRQIQCGRYLVLPELQVTRDTYTTNKGVDLWSYKVPVEFFGVEKEVGLRTPGEKTRSGDGRDKYGYNLLDTMLEVLGTARLAVIVDRDSNGNVYGVKYYAGGIKFKKNEPIFNGIQVETQKASSEGLLRSAINDLSVEYNLDLPTL